MNEGKKKCEALKMIRKQLAEANGIEYAPTECHYEGECKGTCPKCEAELEYLTKAINAKKKPRIVGVAPIKKTVMGVVTATAIGLSMAACGGGEEGEVLEGDPWQGPDTTEHLLLLFDENCQIIADSLNKLYSKDSSDFIHSKVFERADAYKVNRFEFFEKNMKYPKSLEGRKDFMEVLMLVVVNLDGSLEDAVVFKSLNEEADAEALRLVRSIPSWTPARNTKGFAIRAFEIVQVPFPNKNY